MKDQKILLRSINWDNIIILDACRYDIFRDEWLLNFPVLPVASPASWTLEWLDEVFGDIFLDVIVFSSTPYINSITEVNLHGIRWDAREHFSRIVDLWLNAWDEKMGTVPPDKVYLAVNAYLALERHIGSTKRKIIWFMQPHYPYLSKQFEYILKNNINKLSYKDFISGRLDKILRNIILKIARENVDIIIRAYKETLAKTLEFIYKLINKLEGTIIITSDHGELLGESIMKQMLSTFINLALQGLKEGNLVHTKRRLRIFASMLRSTLKPGQSINKSYKSIGAQYMVRGRVFFHPPLLYSTTLRKVPLVIIK